MTAHRINHAEIELGVGSRSVGEALLERLGVLRDRRISPLIDRLCSEVSGPGRLDRIERLELDLGSVALDDFDDDFIRKLEAALRKALVKAVPTQPDSHARIEAALELVEIHAWTGNLPWWADAAGSDPVRASIELLAAESPQALVALVRELARDGAALARVLRSVEVAVLERLLRGDLGASFEAVLGQAIGLLEGVDSRTLTRLRSVLLGGVELAAARQQPTATEPDAASASIEVDAGEGPLSSIAEPERSRLLARIDELLRVAIAAARAIDERTGAPSLDRSTVDSYELLVTRLRELVDGWLGAWISHELEHAIARPALLASIEREDASWLMTRLHALIDEAFVADPTPGDEPPRPSGDRGLLARIHALLLEVGAAGPDARASSGPSITFARRLEVARVEPGRVEPTTRANSRPRDQAARRRASQRLDELFVDDAGLVLLWPFFPRFFERVGLVGPERGFVDDPARMQAIALLRQLVSEDPDPPEYRLPLAKLLCGLAPLDEFVLEQPLAREQIDECERLLTAVIDNLPIFNAMSVASFRATFLQRQAVLRTRDDAWLLQVEREDYDLVLERLPWSWDWMKLPWMSDPIRVEW